MSSTSGTLSNLAAILVTTSFAFAIHQCWTFDRCRCLIPRRKDWFRALLCWMLLLANAGLVGWAIGWAYVKYQLGWVIIPGYGAVPVPDVMWTNEYKRLNTPLELMLNISCSMVISLSAEEGLYWFHLMRAIRQPRLASSWMRSNFFYTWVALSAVTITTLMSITWTNRTSFNDQLAKGFLCSGVAELLVVLMGSLVIRRFPSFLQDVKESGAGPEILARLHFYNETNKIRTFFRTVFSICIIILGVDALTPAQKINRNPLGSDVLYIMSFLSYFFALVSSSMVYLPRNWSHRYQTSPPQILIANPNHPNHLHSTQRAQEASFALMSLLREGGQWEFDDHEPQLKRSASSSNDSLPPPSEKHVERQSESASSVFGDAIGERGMRRTSMLEDWQGPFSVALGERPVPKDLRIMVEQEHEVYAERNESKV